VASICAAPCHLWSYMSHMVTLVTLGHMCHMYLCLSIQISAYTIFVTKTREVTIPGNSLCLGSYSYEKILSPGSRISQEIAFPGSNISQEVTFPKKTFPEKSHFLGSQISREIIFPGKSYFPVSCIFRELIIPGKVTLGCQI